MHLMNEAVLQKLHLFYKTGLFCDVRLQIGADFIAAHSLILRAVSAAVINTFKDTREGILNINIEGAPELKCIDCLGAVLDFFYGQDFAIDFNHLAHIRFLMTSLRVLPTFIDIFEGLVNQLKQLPPNDKTENFYKNIGGTGMECNDAVTEQNENLEDKESRVSEHVISNEMLEVCIVELEDNELDSSYILNVDDSRIESVDGLINEVSFTNKLDELKTPSNNRLLNCLDCEYQCFKPSDLLVHVRKANHGGRVCSLCFSKFNCNELLLEHLGKHDHPKPFFCMLCEQRFQTRALIAQHLPKHSTETPYVCLYCKKGFKWKHGLKSHLIVHTKEKKHLCDECGYSTPHAKTLRAHKLTHTGDVFRCVFPGCIHTSVRKENMKIHEATHCNDRPFVCEICGHKFTQNKNLKRHSLSHEKNSLKVHLCPHCTFTSFRTDKVKAHILKQHTETRVRGPIDSVKSIPPRKNIRSDKICTQICNVADNSCIDLSVLADAASSCNKISNIKLKNRSNVISQ